MNRSRLGNILLVFIGAVVVVFVVLAMNVSAPPSPAPQQGDIHPFDMSSEFPTIRGEDQAKLETLELDRAFGTWVVQEISVLTQSGQRAGIQGVILLDAPTRPSKTVVSMVCGSPLPLTKWKEPPPNIIGFYIGLLDKHHEPYYLIPLTSQGLVPMAGNLGLSEDAPCPQS